MALVSTTFQATVVALCTVMDSIRDGSGDQYHAEKLAAAVKTYILTGQVATVDSGAAPAGSYTGTGVGTMTINADQLESDLLDTFDAAYDDPELAAHMATNIDDACKASDTVKITSTGTLKIPAGGTAPFSGPGKGKFTGSKSIIENGLKSCYAAMKSMAAAGNAYYALQFSICLTSYLTGGVVNINLQSPFISGTGAGKIA
jgi:hypothetical protein